MSRFYIESATRSGTFNLGLGADGTGEEAVTAFFREHSDLPDTTVVKVFVLDYIGDFQRETRVTRLTSPAKPTKPDAPHALAHSAVPPPRR